MSGPRQVLKNLNLFFESRSFAGNITEFNPPKIELNTDEFRAGGMDGQVRLTMGLNTLDTDFSVVSFDPKLLAMVSPIENNERSFIVREWLEDWDANEAGREIVMRGKVTGLDEGTHTPGQRAQVKVTMNLVYYKESIGGNIVKELDIVNMVWFDGEVDRLAQARNFLGI